MDPFVAIKNAIANGRDGVKAISDKLIEHSMLKAKREALVDELRSYADESTAMMSDKRYDKHAKWLIELRLGYSKALEKSNSITDISKIQGKIECLDNLLNRPQAVIKEYKAMTNGK